MKTPVVRFAPSPTGYLHIGGARTALFNWLFAKHHGGTFLLRIEDTDRARSTDEAIQAIFDGLMWLGITWEGDPVMQFSRAARHRDVAKELVTQGKAYYCYATPEELEMMRHDAMAKGQSPRYDGRWRDRDPKEAPAGQSPAIRLKSPQTGHTTIYDLVQGTVTVDHNQIDDMVLVRSDGTPTYMLSVVVDDHDMGITHIIRGDDHLTNAFRQYQIYAACGWDIPVFAHIPLIHGPDGAKLSKRHGALGVDAYRDMGFLPDAMCNYLLRLGWGHGDDEIIPLHKAIEWFDIDHVGKSPSRFDMAKLINLNAHYMRQANPEHLIHLMQSFVSYPLNDVVYQRLIKGMPGLTQRSKTLVDLGQNASIYAAGPAWPLETTLIDTLKNFAQPHIIRDLMDTQPWTEESLHMNAKNLTAKAGIKLGDMATPLRIMLTGATVSPSVFEIMAILGHDETVARVDKGLSHL